MNTGIYSITCSSNGKRYIGSALRIRSRWACHRHVLRNGRHHSQKLQRAWSKHGEDAFIFEVMIYCDRESLRFFEQRAINGYDAVKSGYNILPDVNGSRGHSPSMVARAKLRAAVLGKQHTPEAIQRMREVQASPEVVAKRRVTKAGQRHSPETIEKMRAAATGRRLSVETRAKLRDANLGKKMSEEHCRKLSAALMGHRKSPEGRANMSAAQQRMAAERRAASAAL